MDVICKNAQFPKETLDFYAQYGVSIPREDGIYTIREVINHTVGRTGIRLDQIMNPKVPIQTSLLSGNIEPSFNITRFRNLDNSELRKEELTANIKTKA